MELDHKLNLSKFSSFLTIPSFFTQLLEEFINVSEQREDIGKNLALAKVMVLCILNILLLAELVTRQFIASRRRQRDSVIEHQGQENI